MEEELKINIHSIIPRSEINGPGSRMVIFFQGCGARCQDCFNPETQVFKVVSLYRAEEIFNKHLDEGIEGITVSGGEPFMQAAELHELLKTAKNDYGLTTVVYTGFTYDELSAIDGMEEIFDFIDVLIDGRYDRKHKERTLLARGSTNQKFHFFTKRYNIDDFYMPGKVEVIIGQDGNVTETGFSKIA
jgi:anaerobic ribonucleoside-triphosphate reductase activating protein